MMYFHLTAAAETLFKDHYTIEPTPAAMPQDGLNWWVDLRLIQDASTKQQVPTCLMVEDISRYALIFTYTGPKFIEHLPAILTARLATHMALLLGVNETSAHDTDTLIDLYQRLAQQLVDRLHFCHDGLDETVSETFDELAAELAQSPRLPESIHQMIEAEVHANQLIRSIRHDSVMPHEQFAQLMNLYVTSNLMSNTEAEQFLNRLGEQVGVPNAHFDSHQPSK
jgi:hypothetical protein